VCVVASSRNSFGEDLTHSTQLYKICIAGLAWTYQVLPPYESRCLLLGLEVLSDRKTKAAALFVRDMLCGRIKLLHNVTKNITLRIPAAHLVSIFFLVSALDVSLSRLYVLFSSNVMDLVYNIAIENNLQL
jgi:hypothetical protein